MAFWKMLKQGYDHFEVARLEPKVDVCDKRYVFDAESSGKFSPADRCPAYRVPEEIAAAVSEKQRRDDIKTAELINRGTPAAPVKMGVDGGMNATFLTAVKSHGGPGAPIRTAVGTIPPHVNPPREPETTAGTMFSLASAESRPASSESKPASVTRSTVQVASAAPTSSGGVGGFFSNLFGSKAEDQGAASASTQPTQTSNSKRTGAKPGQSAARPKPEPAETKTVVNNAAKAPKQETEPQRNTASATGVLNGAAPTVPSGGFENRFGAWN
jgi:hypothetical protein